MTQGQGLCGRIAWVDLGERAVRYEEPAPELLKKYVGGYGLGAYYLYTRMPKGADPLGAEALFGLLTGPLTGTEAVTGNRFVVVGKSPKTGGFGDANCGGSFGPALKHAGLDGVFFTGISKEPVYALVQGGEVTLHDAAPQWGLRCSESEDAYAELHGSSAKAAVIGPAGEKVSALACIINDGGRAAGRSGLGMVMGAKRLKAVVAVPEKGAHTPVADAEAVKALRTKVIKEYFTEENGLYSFFSGTGTPGAIVPNVMSGDAPIKNWKGWAVDYPGAENIDGSKNEPYKLKRYGCWKCPIACGSILEVKEGPYVARTHHPEYETLGSFGSMCLVDNLEAIIKCNEICNEYGMDTISAGCTVAFAMECYEQGVIDAEALGYSLEWGDHQATVRMTMELAMGEGFAGRVFRHGIQAAVRHLHSGEAWAIHCGGEELAMHDPRCFPGLGVSYWLEATPGRHTQGGSWNLEGGRGREHFDDVERLEIPVLKDRYKYSGKGRPHRLMSAYQHVMNASGMCLFGAMSMPAEALQRFLSLVTGEHFGPDEIFEIGDRIATLRMAFNLREGVRNLHDYSMPPRSLGDPPLDGGAIAGVTVDNDTQVREYLQAMGWDMESGAPGAENLRGLGLDFALDCLE